MIAFTLIDRGWSTAFAGELGAALVAGVAIGSAYFLALRWSVQLFVGGPVLLSVALQALRFALLAVIFVAITRGAGAAALLAATAGLLVARTMALRGSAR